MVRKRITTGFLDVAETLLTPPIHGDLYGWWIIRTTGRAAPVVYRALRELAADGWVDARWSDDSCTAGPRRRIYEVTYTGRAGLVDLLDTRRPRKLTALRHLLIAPASANDIAQLNDITPVDAYHALLQLCEAVWATTNDADYILAMNRVYVLTTTGRIQAARLPGLQRSAA